MTNVYENQVFTRRRFPAGGVFVNCTFLSSCRFGEGSVFRNCRFVNPRHRVGANSVFDGCTIRWTVVEPNSTISNSSVRASVIRPPSFRSGNRYESEPPQSASPTNAGAITHSQGTWHFNQQSQPPNQQTPTCDWDKRLCEDGAIHIPDGDCATVELDLIKPKD